MSQRLTVYIRTGCHLCEDMLLLLHELQPDLGFGLDLVDISGNQQLEAQYGTKVPVLMAAGQEICHYFLDKAALVRYIEGA